MPDRIYLPPDEASGNVISVNGQCYERVGDSEQSPTVPSIEEDYSNCDDCETRYQLTDCNDIEDPIYTYTDLSSYVGKVVKISGGDHCWTVSESTTPGTESVSVASSYDSCAECFGCENAHKCGDCCFSENSKVRVSLTMTYTDEINCLCENLTDISGGHELDFRGIIGSGSSAAATWSLSDPVSYNCDGLLNICTQGNFDFKIYILVSYECSSGNWKVIIQDWIEDSGGSCFNGVGTATTNTTDNTCCGVDTAFDFTSSSGFLCGAAIGEKMGTVNSIRVIDNGCCYNGATCQEGTVVCSDGSCNPLP